MTLDEIPAYLINLKIRPKRLERSIAECVSFFGRDRVEVIQAVRNPNDTMRAIAESHQKCIATAKNSGHKQVLVLEDDIRFTSAKARPYLDDALLHVPEDWEILTGGIFSAKTEKYSKWWLKASDFYGGHFLIVNSIAFDRILAFDRSDHIDAWISKNFKCYTTPKMFAVQHNGFSDNSKRDIAWSSFLKRSDLLK